MSSTKSKRSSPTKVFPTERNLEPYFKESDPVVEMDYCNCALESPRTPQKAHKSNNKSYNNANNNNYSKPANHASMTPNRYYYENKKKPRQYYDDYSEYSKSNQKDFHSSKKQEEKNIHFAGSTFTSSPAPSSLPQPTFFDEKESNEDFQLSPQFQPSSTPASYSLSHSNTETDEKYKKLTEQFQHQLQLIHERQNNYHPHNSNHSNVVHKNNSDHIHVRHSIHHPTHIQYTHPIHTTTPTTPTSTNGSLAPVSQQIPFQQQQNPTVDPTIYLKLLLNMPV
eukprot:c11414_g1_i1.p2 GENE.c11414_g1_i1~~c11414_g1_i1.p2  ORF type:complete len:281 (-),score=86.63 c11414_g1_i1:799-1641(-)